MPKVRRSQKTYKDDRAYLSSEAETVYTRKLEKTFLSHCHNIFFFLLLNVQLWFDFKSDWMTSLRACAHAVGGGRQTDYNHTGARSSAQLPIRAFPPTTSAALLPETCKTSAADRRFARPPRGRGPRTKNRVKSIPPTKRRAKGAASTAAAQRAHCR